jgi:poly(hydroxyalkanoate) depolymerase family esterase
MIDMYIYAPDRVQPGAKLVVSLHGCHQDAATYSGNGWKDLAEQWNLLVLYPQQRESNNPLGCWSWFRAEDIRRGQGEAASIRQMIDEMLARYPIDEERIYIEGLSAGGWMTAVMLACYPDVFAAGATIAGGPAYCAITYRHFWDVFGMWNGFVSTLQTNRCMDGLDKQPSQWDQLIMDHGFGDYNGAWPRISIWHGAADTRVDPLAQQELLEQWTAVHSIDAAPDRIEQLGPGMQATHKEYHDDEGAVLVETYRIQGMGHSLPIAAQSCGKESEYIREADICAVRRIGRFWSLDQ